MQTRVHVRPRTCDVRHERQVLDQAHRLAFRRLRRAHHAPQAAQGHAGAPFRALSS